MKIKKGDTVLIISGKDKGKTGKVIRSFPSEGRLAVEGVNMIKKHQKARKKREQGEIVQMPASLSVSNVKLICPKCGKTTRAGYKIINEKKNRVCKKCEKKI